MPVATRWAAWSGSVRSARASRARRKWICVRQAQTRPERPLVTETRETDRGHAQLGCQSRQLGRHAAQIECQHARREMSSPARHAHRDERRLNGIAGERADPEVDRPRRPDGDGGEDPGDGPDERRIRGARDVDAAASPSIDQPGVGGRQRDRHAQLVGRERGAIADHLGRQATRLARDDLHDGARAVGQADNVFQRPADVGGQAAIDPGPLSGRPDSERRCGDLGHPPTGRRQRGLEEIAPERQELPPVVSLGKRPGSGRLRREQRTVRIEAIEPARRRRQCR